MNELKNGILKEIFAPGLRDPNYGSNIKTQFENIDDNFKAIAGTDFLKGLDGDSIILKEIDFNETDEFGNWVDPNIYIKHKIGNVLYQKLTIPDIKNSIRNAIIYNISKEFGEDSSLMTEALASIPKDNGKYDISTVNYDDYLKTNSKIVFICAIDKEYDYTYIVSSLPYVFYDA